MQKKNVWGQESQLFQQQTLVLLTYAARDLQKRSVWEFEHFGGTFGGGAKHSVKRGFERSDAARYPSSPWGTRPHDPAITPVMLTGQSHGSILAF